MRDPFTRVRGKGLLRLRSGGVAVAAGLLESQAARLNAPYLMLQRRGRPWVILKWAQSLDGKIATRTGESRWISGERSRAAAHRIRGRVDAVVVGVETVARDDPMLTCRLGRPRRNASRVVIDPQLRIGLTSRLVRTAKRHPTIVACGDGALSGKRAAALRKAGVELIGLGVQRSGGLDLGELLEELGGRRMTNIMVEGGGRTLGAFWDAGLADEAAIFVAPRLIGGEEAVASLGGVGPARMRQLREPLEVADQPMGRDRIYRLVFTDPDRI